MYVVDTDVCVDALRGKQDTLDALALLEAEAPLALSAVTAHELWQGAYAARRRDASVRAVERFLTAFDVLPYDAATAAALSAKVAGIGDLDTMIAATSLHHRAALITRNVRHFKRVPGLGARSP